jgi:hypothetical protein
MNTFTEMTAEAQRLCELVAEACALAGTAPEPGYRGHDLLVEALHIREELRTLATAVDDPALCSDAEGAIADLQHWLARAEARVAIPEALSA